MFDGGDKCIVCPKRYTDKDIEELLYLCRFTLEHIIFESEDPTLCYHVQRKLVGNKPEEDYATYFGIQDKIDKYRHKLVLTIDEHFKLIDLFDELYRFCYRVKNWTYVINYCTT